jgi:hypothetical protein
LKRSGTRFAVAWDADQTRAELAVVASSVGEAVKAFYAAGSEGSPPDLRKGERQVLIERPALEDALAAEVSNGLLEDAEIEATRRVVEELEARSAGWLTAAVIEVGAPIGDRVQALLAELVQELSLVTALAQLADPRSDLRNVAGRALVGLGIAMPWGESSSDVPGGTDVAGIASEWKAVQAGDTMDERSARIVATISANFCMVVSSRCSLRLCAAGV